MMQSGNPTIPVKGIQRVVVAFDGSEPSVRAVRFALALLSRQGGEAWIVHATDPPRAVAEPRTDEEQGTETTAIEQALRTLRDPDDATGPTLHVWIREGAPAEAILAAASEVNADLIVLGTRGLRAASRLVLGSVSLDVLLRAGRPVTVVP